MNTKYHAYALTEMLIIIAMIVVVMALSVRPLRNMLSEIPRSARACQTLNTTTQALKQIKQDVEQSSQIIDLTDNTLILEQPDGTVTYTFTAGQITRRPGLQPQDDHFTWQLPNVLIETNLWQQNGTPYAVELATYNQQIVLGRKQTCFKQSTVFFQKEERQ